jgi:hypothetical protein
MMATASRNVYKIGVDSKNTSHTVREEKLNQSFVPGSGGDRYTAPMFRDTHIDGDNVTLGRNRINNGY